MQKSLDQSQQNMREIDRENRVKLKKKEKETEQRQIKEKKCGC